MTGEMTSVTHLEIVYLYKIITLAVMYAANIPHQSPAALSLAPVVDFMRNSMSKPCESFKTLFGITYEQMLEKNQTALFNVLHIDEVTQNGNVKYNLSSIKRLSRTVKNAEEIVVLVHGFLESSDGWMVSALAPILLTRPGLKILALDGSKVMNFEYFSSSTYARFMGEKLGSILAQIIKDGQDPAKITLIGHSLGAHIAGAAGKRVQQLTGNMLGRITAMDPAGPCFNISPDGRLDSGDAAYVEVIHTNAGVLGFKDPVGHRDFYPNGGRNQPGCTLATCAHSRAWELFAESLEFPKHFPGRKCDSWENFKEGQCSKNPVAYMGINYDTGNNGNDTGSYFLNTAPSSPFGLGMKGLIRS